MERETYQGLTSDVILSGRYGEKAKNLHKLSNLGYQIAPGYAISIDVFKEYCKDNTFSIGKGGYEEKKEYVLGDYVKNILKQLWDTIHSEYTEKLAVRSSCDGEDMKGASAAGIYESILNVETYPEFEKAVITVWNSFFSEAAIKYREDRDIDAEGMGIVVEQMIPGEVSGVLFTINPVDGKNQIVLEVTHGLAENVVSNIDKATIYKVDKEIKEHESYEVSEVFTADENALYRMDESLLNELCSKAIEIERKIGRGCDIEWTVNDSNICFLQVREITADNSEIIPYSTMSQDKNNCVLLDRYSIPASILYLSLLEHWQQLVYLDFEDNRLGNEFQEKPLHMYYNRVYWNIEYQHKYFSMAGFGEEEKKKFLVKDGYEQWYNKLDLYQQRISDYAKRIESSNTLEKLQNCLEDVLNNFCSYIGIDHYRMLGMANICYEQLTNMLEGIDNPKASVSRLLRSVGLKNMTEKSNEEIMDLADYINSKPSILAKIKGLNSKEALDELEKDAEFSTKFSLFMEQHGHRGVSSDDLLFPHWVEEPSYLMDIIMQIVGEHEGGNKPDSTKEELCKLLDEFQIEEKWTEEEKKEIERMTHLTARYMALREDQRYYFDKSWVLLRRIFLKIADTMCQKGILEDRQEVFLLHIDEIFAYLKDENTQIERNVIKRRKKAFERNIQFVPPYCIRDGQELRIQKDGYKKRYKGTVICSGYVEGNAKIVKSSRDLEKVQAGDIIVVPTFHPSWTPILRIAGGMLMNYGNILSHGAVMAREYGIPVVAFNGIATEVFQDNERIVIDAMSGRIIRAIES